MAVLVTAVLTEPERERAAAVGEADPQCGVDPVEHAAQDHREDRQVRLGGHAGEPPACVRRSQAASGNRPPSAGGTRKSRRCAGAGSVASRKRAPASVMSTATVMPSAPPPGVRPGCTPAAAGPRCRRPGRARGTAEFAVCGYLRRGHRRHSGRVQGRIPPPSSASGMVCPRRRSCDLRHRAVRGKTGSVMATGDETRRNRGRPGPLMVSTGRTSGCPATTCGWSRRSADGRHRRSGRVRCGILRGFSWCRSRAWGGVLGRDEWDRGVDDRCRVADDGGGHRK